MRRMFSFGIAVIIASLAGSVSALSTIQVSDGISAKLSHFHVRFDINADASFTETIESDLKALNEKGIDSINKRPISYSDSLYELQILSAYTLKGDGKKIEVPQTNYQIQTNTGENGAAPFASDIKTKSILFPDVAVGDSTHLAYRLVAKRALFPGHFSFARAFPDTTLLEDAEFTVTAPASLPLYIEQRGVEFKKQTLQENRIQWTWKIQIHPAPHSDQRNYTSAFDYAPFIVASTFKDYSELAAAYNQHAKAEATDRIHKLAEEISAHATTKREIAQALYEWVSSNIHYVKNQVGIGSVVPRNIDNILDNKVGDCKDHTALLQALLAAKGIESSPALINTERAYTLPKIPAVAFFNHVINYIPELDLYVDSTSKDTPFGMLPLTDEGKPVILTSHFQSLQHTPVSEGRLHAGKADIDIRINEDGSADATLKSSNSGAAAQMLRTMFQRIDMMEDKDKAITFALKKAGFSGTGHYLRYDSPSAKSPFFNFEMSYHVNDVLELPGPVGITASAFIASHYYPLGAFLEDAFNEVPRHDSVCMGGISTVNITYHLPEKLDVIATPRDAHLSAGQLSYNSEFIRQGRTLISKRTLADNTAKRVCTPEDFRNAQDFKRNVIRNLKGQIIFQAAP